jgi:broad specificity phosphatase PhoE
MASAAEVVIVQHADKQRLTGDPGLTNLGRRQAAATARWLAAHLTLASLWSSPLRRAVETAAPIAHPATVDARLAERMNWTDPSAQSLEQFLAEWAAATDDRDFAPTSGDSSHAAAARFLDFLDDLAGSGGRGVHAVVTHGGVTVDLLRTLLGDDHVPAGLVESGMPSCGLTRLTHRVDSGWSVDAIAQTGHLRRLDR